MYGLSFDDWNFDGHLDIGLWAYLGGSMRNDPHYYWLWDNSLKQFIRNEELEEISNISTISVEENRLDCYTRLGASGGANAQYEYIKGNFVLVYSVEWVVEPAADKENEYIRYEIINELVDGEMITTENYYSVIEENNYHE